MPETYFRSGQAAKLLQISSRDLRRLCELGMIEAEFSDGRQWRIPTREVERLQRQGLPPIPSSNISPGHESNRAPHSAPRLLAEPSDDTIDAADEVVRLENQVQSLGLKRQIEEQQDWFRERERQAAAREEAQLQQIATDRQNSEQRRRWEEWRNRCLAWAMRCRPSEISKEADIDIAREVALVLENLGPDSTEFFVRRQVEGASLKGLRPWLEARDTETAIQEACTSVHIPYRFQSTDAFQGRARSGARSEIEKLPPGASRPEKLQAARGAAEQALREAQDAEAAEALVRSCVMALAGATAEERQEAEELAQVAVKGIAGRRERENAIDGALAPLRGGIEARQERAMREDVITAAKWTMLRLPQEPTERALTEIQEKLDKMPPRTPRPELERVRDAVIERHRNGHARAEAKRQLIDGGLSEIFGYLFTLKLEDRYKFGRNESPWTLERELREEIRRRLERDLDGSETLEAVKKRVRALVRRELGID